MEQHNGAMAKSTMVQCSGAMDNGAKQWNSALVQWQKVHTMAESAHNSRKCTQWQKVH